MVENLGDHMFGNVYCKVIISRWFRTFRNLAFMISKLHEIFVIMIKLCDFKFVEEDMAEAAMKTLNGRYIFALILCCHLCVILNPLFLWYFL